MSNQHLAIVALCTLAACGDDTRHEFTFNNHTDASVESSEGSDGSSGSARGNPPSESTRNDVLTSNGDKREEHRTLSGFTKLRNDSPFNVDAEQGDAFAVVLDVDSNLLPYLETTVAEGTLYIDWTFEGSSILQNPGSIHVTLPQLEGAHVSGSGSLALRGSAPSLELSASGSGGIDARNFTAATGEVTTSGSGSISATYTDEVSASTSGSGSIEVYGGAALSERESGSGRVTAR